MAVMAIVLAIVIAAPQYADPVAGAGDETLVESLPAEAVADVEEAPARVVEEPTSKTPDKLRGYRWPVRGGMVARYYEEHPKGDFQVAGERIHDGLLITWFEGAWVKSAHKGTVVAAGRDWLRHVGFDESVAKIDDVYKRYAPIGDPKRAKKSGKPWFPEGVVVDDGNGYYSVYTEIKELQVEVGDKVKAGQPIGRMSKAEGGLEMMRYRLIRMDGPMMRVHQSARDRGYPHYARERVDPLAVLDTEGQRIPQLRRNPPADPPRLSEY